MATAIFAAGCFWGIEVEFRNAPGVTGTEVGYTGGHQDDPSYEDVCTGRTGHAEAVKVEFDPTQSSYEQLLNLFWTIHDPTQKNRQGPDVGSQYRSAIFTTDDDQRQTALKSRDQLALNSKKAIATEVVEATTFWPAEHYHQRYLEKRGLASCRNPALMVNE
jgi:peptide-methionine (S)-S-oxide reductase